MPGSEDAEFKRRDIALGRRREYYSSGNEVLDNILVSLLSYDSLCYLLLFPGGRHGWYANIRINGESAARRKKLLLTCSIHRISSSARTISVVVCDQIG